MQTGKTAFDYAMKKSHTTVLQLLSDHKSHVRVIYNYIKSEYVFKF